MLTKIKLSSLEVAKILQDFLDGTGDAHLWDKFTHGMSLEDRHLDAIRIRCAGLSEAFPAIEFGHYCNDQGFEVIRPYIRALTRPK